MRLIFSLNVNCVGWLQNGSLHQPRFECCDDIALNDGLNDGLDAESSICRVLPASCNSQVGIFFHFLQSPLVLPVPPNYLQEPFREPVDWQALGLFDYPQVIKKPMDLGLVKKKLNEGKYKTIHDAADDIRLIWKNCMAYNADGSDFYNLAQVRTLLLSSRSLLIETAVRRVPQ